VHAVCSTRLGGCSIGPFAGLNLGSHVGDDPAKVAHNRQQFQQAAAMPNAPVWLNQVHGVTVATLTRNSQSSIIADAAISREPDIVATVMTADCLPLLLCDTVGTQVAAVHAGWRGLCDGIIEATLRTFSPGAAVMAYLGPAISQAAFEVGAEVRAAFIQQDPLAARAFIPGKAGKYQADLYQLARQRLAACGVSQVYGGNDCTYQHSELFFSYRRDGQTGRMASSIWLS
jgi:YfiH family protein